MLDRVYCTVAELVADLRLPGAEPDEEAMLKYILSASDFIDRKLGMFIPLTATRYFDGSGDIHQFIDLVLAITVLTIDGTSITSTQYILYPRARHWEDGPYSRLTVDPDAIQMSTWLAEEDTIAITGRWGKYEKTTTTGATVQNTTSIAAGGTSLLVANGSKLSPGMVLLIESEQLLVTATEDPTDSTTNTAEAITATADSFAVGDGTKVKKGEIIQIELEDMKVLKVATNSVYVARGWNGTAKVAHATDKDIYRYITFTVERGKNGTTDAAHLNGVAISRYIPPYEINWLCRQMAGLHKKKADSSFAGKVGNAELGETFYFDELPKSVYEKIAANYRVVGL